MKVLSSCGKYDSDYDGVDWHCGPASTGLGGASKTNDNNFMERLVIRHIVQHAPFNAGACRSHNTLEFALHFAQRRGGKRRIELHGDHQIRAY